MEQREHPRIQLPLLVEIHHPLTGRRRCLARDVSEGGVYVQITDTEFSVGAKLKLTLLNPHAFDTQPTPTVEMEIRRIDGQGLGLSFVSNTSRFLWESVERLRTELEVGRDYFQAHLSIAALNRHGELFLVQQHGRWLFPGTYLKVGDQWRTIAEESLLEHFGLEVVAIEQILGVETASAEQVPEAAVMQIFALVTVEDAEFEFPEGGAYRAYRWIERPRDIGEMTLADPTIRAAAVAAIEWFRARERQQVGRTISR